ncbi:MAG: thioesterase family protein [Anaerolineae bacterium]|nr:thioesterase family protein [Anaerolineae bacterium]
MTTIQPGLTGASHAAVTEDLLATHFGSGAVEVYATPAMIALMEAAAIAAIDPLLPDGQASVGTAIAVKHLAATPLDDTVRAQAEVIAVEGRLVTFQVEAWDSHERIGEGTHTRFVIDLDRFMQRVGAKRA